MANYVPSDLVLAQARLQAAFASSELRFRDPVTFREFQKNTSIAVPSLAQLRTREDRPESAYFKNRTARALGTGGRTHNHTGVKGDSTAFTPTWVSYEDTFNISLKTGDNNVFNHNELMFNEVENLVANFSEGLETAAVAHVFSNRSGVNVSTDEGTFDAVDDCFDITASTNVDRAVQIAKGVMHENKYAGALTFFCDTIAFNKFNYQANQGQANNQNLSFQFGGVNFVHSVELGALAGGLTAPRVAGFWIAVPAGTIASLDWIPTQNRSGIITPVGRYGTLIEPVMGLTLASHAYDVAADDSANNGYTQDVVTQWEMSIDVSLENAPLTTATETTLQAFALV